MGDPKTTETMREGYKQEQEKERLKTAEPKFHEAIQSAELIPLRTKTQYPLYLEARSVTMLRAIAEYDDITVQELVRTALDKLIDDRTKKKRRRVTKKGA